MISGENHRMGAVGGRFLLRLPGGHVFDDLLQTAQRAGGLGELRVAGAHGGDVFLTRLRHQRQEVADIVEGLAVGHGGLGREECRARF